MRYYDLQITSPSGTVWAPTSTGSLAQNAKATTTFTSLVGGQTDPGALNIELDIPSAPYHVPQYGSWIRVWGVGLPMLGQAANLNGSSFTLKAGMQKGLPLANPQQAGLISQGQILQAFGNWEGVNQTLELMIIAGNLEPDGGVAFNWQDGQTLDQAIQQSLTTAFPAYKTNVQIESIAGDGQCATWHPKLSGLAEFLNQRTADPDAKYPGVQIAVSAATINVYDYTVPPATPIQLQFQDLIGQPTWIGPTQIAFKTVLRADIDIGDQIKFPKGIQAPFALTSQGAAMPGTPASSKVSFQGAFNVTEAHFFGNFRQGDAASWVTAYVAVPAGSSGSSGASQ